MAMMPTTYAPAELEYFIEQRIQERLSSAMQQTATGNQAVVQQLTTEAGKYIEQVQAAVQKSEAQIEHLKSIAKDADKRMNDRVNEINVLAANVQKLFASGEETFNRTGALETGVKTFFDELQVKFANVDKDLRDQLKLHEEEYETHITSVFGTVKQEVEKGVKDTAELKDRPDKWSKGVDEKIAAAGGPPGLFSGGPKSGGKTKLDKKDLTVWKLEDNVHKLRFRHWVKVVENNLEQVQGWDRASEILDRVRRQETEIDQAALEACVSEAYKAIEEAH